ncbi:uncharacterized protein LY79DRAFT_142672 [Colletotrichum navitas]|uniref:Uncharacterized protein n=1 Tax=Colletotrichum navitas TaxID=681940 RepID=A0AAD8QB89_9PEZI|nr:uncharacterized protein LY79DRAFT_142672 [Colletotrichum navitas]KAK1599498.1 hypothetical protein LY79DRAFT_142672 [Colletotrichum navitas]
MESDIGSQHQCDGVNVPELLDSVVETILRATAIIVLAAPSCGTRSTVTDDVAHRGVSLSNKSKTRSRFPPLGAWSRGMIFASHFRQERDIIVKGREFNSHSVQWFCSNGSDLCLRRGGRARRLLLSPRLVRSDSRSVYLSFMPFLKADGLLLYSSCSVVFIL